MSDIILSVIGRLLGAAAVIVAAYLTPKVKLWLECKAGTEATNGIILMVRELVKAADQLYKTEDPTGEIRNAYVKEQLKALGIEITNEVDAHIEAAVFDLK